MPAVPDAANRGDFDLGEDRNLYLCAQSFFKIHLDIDALLALLAARDPRAVIAVCRNGRPAVR